MQDVLPDMWLITDNGEHYFCLNRHRTMDIEVWAQCFATYVRVIAEIDSRRVPDLLGYMINVIRAIVRTLCRLSLVSLHCMMIPLGDNTADKGWLNSGNY